MGPQMQIDPKQLQRARDLARQRLELLSRRREALTSMVAACHKRANDLKVVGGVDYEYWKAKADYCLTQVDETAMEHQTLSDQVAEWEKLIDQLRSPILVPHLAQRPKGSA